MPFVALCPHCRTAKVSAPTRKRGTLHSCPRCHAEFPLEPMEETGIPVDYKLPPPEFDILKAYEQPARDDFASAPTVVASALTGSAVVPLVEKEPPAPAVVPAEQPIDYTPYASLNSDVPFKFVLFAGFVFGLGMVATQFPYGRFIALPLLITGLLLGFLALPGLVGRESYGWAAVAANALGLVLVVLLPSWLGLQSWVPEGNPDAGPKPVYAVNKLSNERIPTEWVDAVKQVWEQNDVRMEVVTAIIGMNDPKLKPGAPGTKPVLRLTLKITNVGVARAIPFKEWANTPETAPKLSLAGVVLPYQRMETPAVPPINPGKDETLVLVFDAPPPAPPGQGEYSLELAAAAFDGKEPVKFKIPTAMIGSDLGTKK